jgi:uncharacterized protein (TIGR03067 family)
MRFALLTAVAFVFSISAAARTSSDDDVVDNELKKLSGTWEVVDNNVDGQSQTEGAWCDAKVIIGDPLVIVLNHFDSLNYEARLRNVDPSASPSAVDLRIFKDKKTGGGKFPAVYKLDGDDLQICWWFKDEKKPRPTKLEKGEGLRLLVLKRVKETEED